FPGWIARLREAHAARGYPNAQARIVLRDTDDITAKVLRVEVSEGEPLRVSERRFEGERLAPREGVRRVVGCAGGDSAHRRRLRGERLRRRKGMRRILGFAVGDIADRERIEEGLRKAESVLRLQGHYGAQLDQARVEVGEQGARVIIPAHVGPPYEVHFSGH